ncbi:unnamed protein product [Bemisia tabaci]|uniref:Phenoloxidase-activating factor 2 n=1 Tax=Bemisia tabaci TaxID=7038 RepID=A0A9P0A6A0_BEMTA|nr:unnamed protein product [Bemisia tabaci]
MDAEKMIILLGLCSSLEVSVWKTVHFDPFSRRASYLYFPYPMEQARPAAAPPRRSEFNDSVKILQRRKLSLGGGGGDADADTAGSGLKVRPTFGVSFGLPSGGGGYPVNPYSPLNPALNPYGGSIGGPNGVNLGLVNVNPLLSLQVTKDEYGEKIVKPLVNLHVTPNQGLVDKFGYLVHKFKHHPYGYGPGYGPGLYHHHNHYHTFRPPSYGPGYYRPPRPHYSSYGPPPYYPITSPSHHSPEYTHYAPEYNSYRDIDDTPEDTYGGSTYGGGSYGGEELNEYDDYYRNNNVSVAADQNSVRFQSREAQGTMQPYATPATGTTTGGGASGAGKVAFPSDRRSSEEVSFRSKRDADDVQKRQAYYGGPNKCGRAQVCCRRPLRKQSYRPKPVGYAQCGRRNAQGINGRIKNPVFVDGDSEFGEYPWQVAILKKDPQESVYVCGGTLIDQLHIITAAHCVKSYTEYDLRVRLGEWDVNHDVEFYPYVERDVVGLVVHPEFYAGTLYNDIAVLRLDKPVDFTQSPHISPACLPDQYSDYAGTRCWTTGWGKDAFGEQGKYQNILKEVDVPVVGFQQCQSQLQQTRLGYDFKLHPGFVCAGGEEGKDACKGDGGGPMVCERGGTWQVVGIVSWGVGCGKYGVPGVYTKVAYYLDWIRQVTQRI